MTARPRTSTKQQRIAAFRLHLSTRAGPPPLRLQPQREAARILEADGSVKFLAGQPRQRSSAPTTTNRTFNTDKKVEYDATTLITTVTAVATVERPFDDVVQLLDPRAWAKRSDLWLQSYAVQLRNGRALFDRDGVPVRDDVESDPSRWGQPWRGVLYELTDWDMTEQLKSRFDVLLNIEFNQQPPEHIELRFPPGPDESPIENARSLLHRYKLNEALKAQLGYQIIDGGVDVDAGYAYAKECLWQGRRVVRVEAQKMVRYADFTPDAGDEGLFDTGQLFNYLAPGIVGVWIGSLVSEGLNASLDI